MKTITNLSLILQQLCNQSNPTSNRSKSKWLVILSALTLLLIFPFANTFADTDFKQGSVVFTLNSTDGCIDAKIMGQDYQGTNDELDQIILSYLDPITGTWVQFFDGDMDNDDIWEKIGEWPLVTYMSTSATTNYKYGLLKFSYPRALFQNNIVIKAEVDWDIDSNQTNSGIDYTFYYNISGLDDIPWTNFWSTTYDGSKNTLAFNFENCEIYGKGVSQVTEAYEPRNELDTIIVEYQDPRTNQWVKVFTGDCDKNFNDTVFNLTSNTSDGSFTKSTKLAIDRKYLYKTTVLWDKIPSHLWGKTVAFRSKVDWDLKANDVKGGIDQTNIFYITFNSVKKPKTIASGCVYSSENQTVLLKWTDSNNVTNPEPVITYHIKRNLKGSTTSDFITPTEGVKVAEFTDKSFENWKDYVYTIYSIPTSWGWTRNELVQEYSTSYSASTNPKIPLFSGFSLKAFPTNVTISPYVKVSWNKEWSNGNVVKLYQRSADLTAYKLLGVMEPGSTSYIDNDVEDNIKYYYKFEVDLFGTKYYKYDSTIVEKSVTFKSIAASKNTIGDRIQLSWEIDALNLCERFEIYRSYTRDSLGMDVKTTPEMVHQLSAQTLYNKWDDMTAVAGVVYEYRVIAYKTVDGKLKSSKSNSDIGFRTPVGTISGRITYGGGTAVDKVSVYVESSSLDENMLYKSLLFKGENSQKSQVNLTNAQHGCIKNGFSFQSWITSSRPSKYTPVVELSNEYSIGVRNDSILAFIGTFNLAKPSIKCKLDSAIQLNNYFHLSVTLSTDDSLKVYINGNQRAKAVLATSLSSHNCTFSEVDKVVGTVVTPRTKCYIGNKTDETLTSVAAYSGNIDDIRLWGKAISAADILSNYNRYLSGTESGLIGYWPLDEGINSYAFDCSKTNQKFNEHHIKLENSYTSTNVPAKEQLAIKGLTDSNGNYIIRGIPFTGEGSTYAIKPILGTHKFEPSQLVRYISPSSLIHNSSDFADKSSFPVTITVNYKNTAYPVEGVSFTIDDNPVSRENKLVVTDEKGIAEINVPIGEHYIKASLIGHVFRDNGRYPSNGKFVFDGSISEIMFVDTTLVSITGRVAGGLVEDAKSVGFGIGMPNIGSATITLKPALLSNYSLNTVGLDRTLSADLNGKIESVSTIKTGNENDKYITIKTDPKTGEYFVMLPPIKEWTVDNVIIHPKGNAESLSTELYTKSIRPNPLITNYDTLTINNKVDSFKYNIKRNFIYRVDPTIKITDANAIPGAFGDSTYVIKNVDQAKNETIKLYEKNNDGSISYLLGKSTVGDVSYPSGKPIFTMGEIYRFKIESYEEYFSSPTSSIKVPLAGASVTVDNQMGKLFRSQAGSATDTVTPKHEMKLNEEGVVYYRFLVGFPKLTSPQEGMSMNVNINYKNKQTAWGQNNKFRGIVLGYEPVAGATFKTRGPGPHIPLVVLRDPPGSKSYAYMEKGTEIKYSMTHKHTLEGNFSVENKLKFGTVLETSIGLGFTVTTKIKAEDDLTVGLSGEYSSFTGDVNENSLFLKERVQTSSSPDFVGSMADVYIGTSTNVFTTDCNILEIVKVGGVETITQRIQETSDLQSATEFRLSQYEILTAQIPAWEKTIENLFNNKNAALNIYTPLGKLSVKEIIKSLGKDDKGVLLYNVDYGSSKLGDQVDSAFTQIKNWQNLIKKNEMSKFNAKTSKIFEKSNISFDAGTYIDRSYTFSTKTGTTNGSTSKTQESLSNEVGLEINGFGMDITTEQKFGGGRTDESTSTTENSTSFGYVLSDADTDNRFSVNVYKNKFLSSELKDMESENLDAEEADATVGSYIFELAAGQTSCPYESADSTLFYRGHTSFNLLGYEFFKHYTDDPKLPLKQLSVGSQALDVPEITILPGNLKEDVPNGKEANFTLQLESGSTGYSPRPYILSVDDATNGDGAIISVDGTPLTGPRSFYITKGQPLKKTLTIRQSKPDVLKYDSIRLKFSSACDDITDAKYISVHFVPSCSDLDLVIDSLTMNTRTGNSVLLKLRNFSQDYTNFRGIKIQYKLEGAKDWKEKVIAKEGVDFKPVVPDDTIPEQISSMNYRLNFSGLDDGRYQVRAMTICSDPNSLTPIYNITPEFIVVKDMVRPRSMGTPSPSNGILTPEEEIAVTFNEPLQTTRMVNSDFEILGVLNDTKLTHSEGLALSGSVDSEAFTESPVSLGNTSFAIEGWVRMKENSDLGNLFSIGEGANKITLKMNRTNVALYVNDIQIGTETITPKSDWQYVSLNYNANLEETKVFVVNSEATGGEQTRLVKTLKGGINPVGRLKVGSGFNGNIHQVVVWNYNRSIDDLSDMNYTKSGTENNIIGYWPMDEANGKMVADKVRSRNMIVNSAWFVEPNGKSAKFNGDDASVIINTASIPLTTTDNYSLEFWFNGSAQINSTIFSCGKGMDDDKPNDKLSVGFDNVGALSLFTKNASYVIPNITMLYETWHHFAMSVSRNGFTNILVDGQQRLQIPSSNISGLASDKMTIGSRSYYDSVLVDNVKDLIFKQDQHFGGKIDEVRIWNTALTSENIRLDMRSKLDTSTTSGLIAYYPFEKEGKDKLVEFSLQDASVKHAPIGIGSNVVSNDITPGIKMSRPKVNVKFSYTASDNKIIFTIEEPLKKIENCVLEFDIKNAIDMNDNYLSSSIKWTAFVNNNRLNWETEQVSITKEVLEAATFKATIVNRSGKYENYVIDGLPSWLSVNKSSGRLNPLEKAELTFTVDAATNVGSYENRITLTGNNGIQEMLPVTLKVTGPRPDWTVDAYGYESTMNVMGQIILEGVYQEDTEDMLAAFNGTRCVGIASPIFVKNKYVVFMDVYGNGADNGKKLTYSLWDAGTGRIYPNVDVAVDSAKTFIAGSIAGKVLSPIEFNATDKVEQQLSLKQGWTWVSTNVVNTNLLDQFKSGLEASGLQIKNKTGYIDYDNGDWLGYIENINQRTMYLVNASEAKTIKLEGATAKPADLSSKITINKGWSYIGYVPQFVAPVKDALNGLAPKDGDQIKGQIGFATFDNKEWYGSLQYMTPGLGYMYKSAIETSFNYPAQYISQSRMVKQDENIESTKWAVDVNKYQMSMTITGIVSIDGLEVNNTDQQVAVFIGDECRGTAVLKYIESYNRYVAFLMVWGNTDDLNKKIIFRSFNASTNLEISAINESLSFVPDNITGSVSNPYKISFVSSGNASINDNDLKIYPNPTNNMLYFSYLPTEVQQVEVIDNVGRRLITFVEMNKNSINVGNLLPGIYTLRVKHNGIVSNHLFVKY